MLLTCSAYSPTYDHSGHVNCIPKYTACLYQYQIWPTLTVKLWENSDFTGVRDCPLGTKDRFHSTGLLTKGSLVGSSQPSSKSSLISSLDPVYGNCRALLGTVGGKLYLTCANVAHQNSLCSVCQGPFSVECSTSSSHSVLLVVYSHLPIHKWPKAGCDNEFGHKWAPPIHQRVTQSLLHTVHGQLDLASCSVAV